jgi:hypothetical protein
MVSHCETRLPARSQTATDYCAQPESQYISNTQTVRISQKKHSNVLFESVADHYHSSKST